MVIMNVDEFSQIITKLVLKIIPPTAVTLVFQEGTEEVKMRWDVFQMGTDSVE